MSFRRFIVWLQDLFYRAREIYPGSSRDAITDWLRADAERNAELEKIGSMESQQS